MDKFVDGVCVFVDLYADKVNNAGKFFRKKTEIQSY